MLRLRCVVIVLVPVDSLDRLLESLYAAFGQVRSIFIRRHLIGPGLKLLAVLTVVLMGGNAHMLACFYVAAGVGGILIYALLLRQMLRREKLLPFFRPGAWKMPVREIFSFSLPLFSSQIGFVVRTSLAVLLLEMMRGSAEVAELRAVFPFARLNEVVITSFAFLFTPLASRFFARNETEHIDELYWRTSVWITIFSLPAFLVTGVLAQPFTSFVLGERYAAAGPVLLVLATAFFIDAVMGFNVHTLRVFAKVRYIVTIDVIGIVTGVGLCLALIPAWGALGAAVGQGSPSTVRISLRADDQHVELAAAVTGKGRIICRRNRSTEIRGSGGRSEERRVGKECRSRWSPEHEKKKKKNKT